MKSITPETQRRTVAFIDVRDAERTKYPPKGIHSLPRTTINIRLIKERYGGGWLSRLTESNEISSVFIPDRF